MVETLKSLWISIMGTYTPVSYTSYIDSEAVDVIPDGLAGVDIPYVFSCIAFCIAMYSTFRLIGVLFNWALYNKNNGGLM